MTIINKRKYITPRVKISDMRGRDSVLCASGEKYHLPVGIEIAIYDAKDISDADDNDW